MSAPPSDGRRRRAARTADRGARSPAARRAREPARETRRHRAALPAGRHQGHPTRPRSRMDPAANRDAPRPLIFYTGEGIERLLGFARRAGVEADSSRRYAARRSSRADRSRSARCAASSSSPSTKPVEPTTGGLIETLRGIDLAANRVAVQLYNARAGSGASRLLARSVESRPTASRRMSTPRRPRTGRSSS